MLTVSGLYEGPEFAVEFGVVARSTRRVLARALRLVHVWGEGREDDSGHIATLVALEANHHVASIKVHKGHLNIRKGAIGI